MSENLKTVIFVGLAVVLGLVAYAIQPKPERVELDSNQLLVKEYDDPGKAASLEIVTYSPDDAKGYASFRVAKDKKTGLWQIPSHSDYPADAETQMRDVATMFLDFRSLGIASVIAEDHKQFGVLEPDPSKLKPGDEGIGLMVRIVDEGGDRLVNLIISEKTVKGNPDQRFVRVPGNDTVYVAKVDPKKLSTKFEDWIEKDLLKIKTFDVDRLKIRDYSVVRTNQGFLLDPKMDVAVRLNETDNKWKLDSLTTYKTGKPQPGELLEDEELNNTKLDDLKNALDDIKIVDVVRKPTGLGADLRAGREFLDNTENVNSLFSRGFFPEESSGQVEIRAANGELRAGTKDGVDYILRFGNVAGSVDEEKKDLEGNPVTGQDNRTETETKLTRYLFVLAQLDESRFPEPMLEQVPELPADAPASKESPEKKATPESKEATDKTGQCGDDKPADDNPVDDKPVEKKPAEEKPADAKPVDEKASADDEQLARLKAERERIVRDNQRKLDEHKENRKKAEDKVRELNARFADWYYVISEDAYKKVHLTRADVIKEREGAKDEGFGIDAFEKLKQGGLEKKATATEPKP